MKSGGVRFERVATPGQIERTAALADVIWHECYVKILKPRQIDYMVHNLQSGAAIAAHMQNEGYEYFLAYIRDKEAGYVAIQEKDGLLLLSKLYVLAACRGKGIARAALEFVEQAGREKQCVGVWLTVNRNNERAIAVYHKTGYQLTRQQQVDIGGGFVMDDFVFEKPL